MSSETVKLEEQLEGDDDWIDTSVFDRFAELLAKTPSDRRFLASETNTRDFLLVCPTKEVYDRLASLTPERFTAIRSAR